jgi:effector-binding domain-containing protein
VVVISELDMVLRTASRHLCRAAWVGASLALLMVGGAAAAAETAPAPDAPPAVTSPAPAAPASPAPAPAAPETPPAPDNAKPGDASSATALTIEARPTAVWKGSATWDEGFKTIMESFAKINDALAKNGIKPAGRPLAMFTETDDSGFKFDGMIPIEKPADGKTTLSPDVSIGELPAGKVLKFQHRGAYDDIDSTYEAITAYLDEKGLEAKNLVLEEYLNDVKTSDDTSLQVDIYVYLK